MSGGTDYLVCSDDASRALTIVVPVDDGFMGAGRPDATVADIRRALGLYRVACMVQGGALELLALLIAAIG